MQWESLILILKNLNEVLLLKPTQASNGLGYLRWGGDGEAVQPEKCSGVGNCLRCAQNPQQPVLSRVEGLGALSRCSFGALCWALLLTKLHISKPHFYLEH
jgi:hypothetical protein